MGRILYRISMVKPVFQIVWIGFVAIDYAARWK